MSWQVLQADCIEAMSEMEEASVDAIVTDPPYGLEFMGRSWDSLRNGREVDPAFAHWFAGFVDGEGCFSVHKKRPNRSKHETYDCQFSITVRADDRPILDRIQRQLGIGTVAKRERGKDAGNAKAIARYCVSAQAECLILRDVLRMAPLRAKKARDFELWSDALSAWIAHEPGQGWDEVAGHREALMATRAYEAEGVRVSPEQIWHWRWAREALRVLKPGGHLLAFGGTRTYHRLACAIEDAGFELRDCIAWMYGSGFPKSHNLRGEWEGWGTALKPSFEPIVVARKPLIGTVAENVLEHGTGAINVDGCRIGAEGPPSNRFTDGAKPFGDGAGHPYETTQPSSGRWPANTILSHHPDCEQVGTHVVKGDSRDTGDGRRDGGFFDIGSESGDGEPNAAVYGDEEVVAWKCVEGCPVAMLDEQSGDRKAGGSLSGKEPSRTGGDGTVAYGEFKDRREWDSYGDTGGASRFFYQAKSPRAERDAGLPEGQRSSHPTVKPIDLMRWLVRLVAPPGGTILDPFTGSGSTGCAAVLEGFDFIGIEREEEYVEIANARIEFWAEHEGGEVKEVLKQEAKAKKKREKEDAQMELVA